MPQISRRGRLRQLVHSCIAASLTIPIVTQAQDDAPEVEEVVVTGSYIRNSAFSQNSPVDTVSQTDLFESGAPSMSNYIRDLTYTQNTDVVANVLSSQDGAQDAVGASFNLRGLGENSTLSLVDGTRTISAALSATLPEIAMERLELVLDGGSALYGSDAVAGVVNIIPIKDFEGFRARSYYQVTDEPGMEDITASALWGRSFSNDISYVGAFEVKKKTPLMQYERPREWAKDYGTSLSGNPGSFREIAGANPQLYTKHGGTPVGSILRDPSCGTFNDGYPAHGEGKFSIPSGVPYGNYCLFEYTKQFAYSTEEKDYNLYNTISWEATDWLKLSATLNNHYRITVGRTTSTTAVSGNNREVLFIPQDHPANPFGVDLVPWSWRLFTEAYTHMPSHLEGSGGSRAFETHYSLNRAKLAAEYELAGSWSGYTYYSKQEARQMNDSYSIHLGLLQEALQGRGGPNGDEYWNPFGSADPRSPYFVDGVTSNSVELTNSLVIKDKNRLTDRDELEIFETLVTGELFELPAGTVQTAIGYQWRDVTESEFANPVDAAGIDYNTVVGAPLPVDTRYFSEVRAAFVEFQVPIFETVDLQLAVRHEQFKDFGLDATTPKVAIRWEALPDFAVRASWGESFLAPTPTQARPFIPNENCGELFNGLDPLTNTSLVGATTCSSGNPNLSPETSTIRNVGFTWEPSGEMEGLSVSMDYQEIEYVDRIRSLTSQDTAAFQFQQFLSQSGYTEANYDPTPGSASRNAADAYLASIRTNPGNPIERYPDNTVKTVYTQASNISSVWINLVDFKARYTFDTNDWGSFGATLQTTYYTDYEYQDLFGGVKDALGYQNANTGIVPPLPQYRTNLTFNWFRGNQSASISANYWDSVKFDDRVRDLYGQGWVAPNEIDGEMRVNARYAIVLDDYLDSEFLISAGINNVFDVRPQRMGILGGFESRLSTPWGRQFWVSLEWTPGA
ncbi:MAG: TonB-dependent receptor [Pseudohongiellaceae bacterium]|nr:TonB-dependent receptor [Pseudohongiellaceae bacterium]